MQIVQNCRSLFDDNRFTTDDQQWWVPTGLEAMTEWEMTVIIYYYRYNPAVPLPSQV